TNPSNTDIYTLSLHDALPIFEETERCEQDDMTLVYFDMVSDTKYYKMRYWIIPATATRVATLMLVLPENETRNLEKYAGRLVPRSEEHTSELQSRENLVCRLL